MIIETIYKAVNGIKSYEKEECEDTRLTLLRNIRP